MNKDCWQYLLFTWCSHMSYRTNTMPLEGQLLSSYYAFFNWFFLHRYPSILYCTQLLVLLSLGCQFRDLKNIAQICGIQSYSSPTAKKFPILMIHQLRRVLTHCFMYIRQWQIYHWSWCSMCHHWLLHMKYFCHPSQLREPAYSWTCTKHVNRGHNQIACLEEVHG